MIPAESVAESDSSASPSGRSVSTTVRDSMFASSTSVTVALGAISTPVPVCGLVSLNVEDEPVPAAPLSRSTTGASFTQVTVTATVAVSPSLTV